MNFTEMARKIIKENRFLSLATCNGSGEVWATPLSYSTDNLFNFYITTAIDSVHIDHIKENPYALKVFNQKENLDFYLPISCICVIGLNDQLQTYDPEKAFEILKNKFMNFRGCSLPGDHELIPMQAMLVDVIKKWLATVD